MDQKDFFVFYSEEDELAQYFSQHLVDGWQTKYGLSGINHHEDSLLGTTRLDSLGYNLDRCRIAVIVLTKTFIENHFDKFANNAAFLALIESISTTPRYIPVGVGLKKEEFPVMIKDVLNVAVFPEVGYETADQLWKRMDNVLVVNRLITTAQLLANNSSRSNSCSDNAAGSSMEIVYNQTPMVDPTFRSPTQEQGPNPYQQQQTARKQIELPNPAEVDARPILVHRPSGDGEDVPFPLIPTDYQATPENEIKTPKLEYARIDYGQRLPVEVVEDGGQAPEEEALSTPEREQEDKSYDFHNHGIDEMSEKLAADFKCATVKQGTYQSDSADEAERDDMREDPMIPDEEEPRQLDKDETNEKDENGNHNLECVTMEQDNTHLDSAEDRGKDDEGEYPVIPYQEEPRNNGELNGGGEQHKTGRHIEPVSATGMLQSSVSLTTMVGAVVGAVLVTAFVCLRLKS